MIVLIAEKPNVGMELARITGCRDRHDGYVDGGRLHGQPCSVTWASGHLVSQALDEHMRSLAWKKEHLPLIPERFILEPNKGKDGKRGPASEKQLKVITSLFAKADVIVNCGDAGREGEVIQRWIDEYACERDPRCGKAERKRLWISSLTDEAIRNGLADLRPASEFDNLYRAGRARAEADWLVGVNATEALSLKANLKDANGRLLVLSIGRVQTPTLALVCSRYLEHKAFVPTPFWTVRLHTESRGVQFHVNSERKFTNFGEAESLSKRAGISLLQVTEAEHQARIIKTPLLHDQTSIQQEASRRYDYSPEETLAAVQDLYEKKLVTYPRTGSPFIPHDVLRTIPQRIATLTAHAKDPAIRAAALRMSVLDAGQLGKRSVNDGKVTDHHGLLVEKTAPPELTGRELNVYNLIAERMLEAFAEPCETDVLSCRFTCAGETFLASSTRIVKPGWKAVRGAAAVGPEKPASDGGDDRPEEQQLPELKAGDMLNVKKSETVQGSTKPKPLYTYESLLEAMKNAGRDSEDDEVKAAMKDIGIGTAATRAGILALLQDERKYIKKLGKKLVPTDKGLEVYEIVKTMPVSDVDLTGRWEAALALVEEGAMPETEFRSRIRTFTMQITRQLLAAPIGDNLTKAAEAENIRCPLCGATVKLWENNARCMNNECGLSVNRTVAGRKLAESTMKKLLETGKTGLVKGLKNKEGKTFEARLKLVITEKDGRKYGNTQFFFNDKKFNNKKPWKK